ncbi:MAG: hypothetical protein LC647_01755 [Beggiatoa sp.]|nr:hypothetical protein [Beggiatoa sp.]
MPTLACWGWSSFDNENLYGNVDCLSARKPEIKGDLFQLRPKESASALFLYDVTSSYLEGEHNELGAFGYKRDGKRASANLSSYYATCAERAAPG